ncbi:hypothetical protein ACFWWT_22120 [Streptomyces sp. NPDC058676]|uniref:hypothetical protein n=1 Tax=unclassified Streptomyces TaxID=2593676 RepID=UPI00365B9DEB
MLLMVSAIAGNIYGITANHVDVFRVVPETALVVGVLCLAGPSAALRSCGGPPRKTRCNARHLGQGRGLVVRDAPAGLPGANASAGPPGRRVRVVRVKGGWAPGSAY